MLPFKTDKSWSLFLDRDGVINKRKIGGYISSIKEFEFLPGAIEGLKRLSGQFHKIFIVTNQQGVGKGIISTNAIEEIHSYMLNILQQEHIVVDKIYVAGNIKGEINDRRKPGIAMGLEAKSDFPTIDFIKSIMVGDTDSDLQFGKNLGIKTVLIKTEEKTVTKPDMIVNNLNELADELFG